MVRAQNPDFSMCSTKGIVSCRVGAVLSIHVLAQSVKFLCLAFLDLENK